MTQADREEQAAAKKQKGQGGSLELLQMLLNKDVTQQMVNIVQAQIGGDSLKAAQMFRR